MRGHTSQRIAICIRPPFSFSAFSFCFLQCADFFAENSTGSFACAGIHNSPADQAIDQAVNTALIRRNWLLGYSNCMKKSWVEQTAPNTVCRLSKVFQKN